MTNESDEVQMQLMVTVGALFDSLLNGPTDDTAVQIEGGSVSLRTIDLSSVDTRSPVLVLNGRMLARYAQSEVPC